MPEEFMAANAGEAPEGSASPIEGQAANAGAQASEGPASPQGQANTEPDITQTQVFARRVKEATEKAKQEERDALIAELYGQSHGIRTYADFRRAREEAQRDAEIQRMAAEGINREYAEKLLKVDELERWKNDAAAKETKAAENRARAQRRDAMYAEFLEDFPDFGTEDKLGEIPKEVFSDAKKWIESDGREGRRLSDAFARHQYGRLQKERQTQASNRSNAESSTGSVRGGGPGSQFFTREQVMAMSVAEIQKNRKAIDESMRRWS